MYVAFSQRRYFWFSIHKSDPQTGETLPHTRAILAFLELPRDGVQLVVAMGKSLTG